MLTIVWDVLGRPYSGWALLWSVLWASLLTWALASRTIGGARQSLRVRGRPRKPRVLLKQSDDDLAESDNDEEEDEGEGEDEDLGTESTETDPDTSESEATEYKMVLVVRTDLQMTKGKMMAQIAHAVLANYKLIVKQDPQTLQAWEASGQPKIALKIDSEAALLGLREAARAANLCAQVIRDAGRTQVAPGTFTVLAIGPGDKRLIDRVTGSLKLL